MFSDFAVDVCCWPVIVCGLSMGDEYQPAANEKSLCLPAFYTPATCRSHQVAINFFTISNCTSIFFFLLFHFLYILLCFCFLNFLFFLKVQGEKKVDSMQTPHAPTREKRNGREKKSKGEPKKKELHFV